MSSPIEEKKKRVTAATAWRDARELIWTHRYRLAVGMILMLINRVVGLVLPASSKYLIDDVILKHRSELLIPLALAAGGATILQAFTSFTLADPGRGGATGHYRYA
jgi:subfamily B ATP-binding cassette protein MsbA